MGRHPNAKLTPRGRKTLVPRMESGAPIVDAARQMGCRPPNRQQVAAAQQARRGTLRPERPHPEAREVHARGPITPPTLRAGAPGRARPRRRQENGAHTRRRRAPRAGARMRVGGRRQASCLHVAVDDRSGVAYAELLPDERWGACAASSSTVSGPSAQRVRGPSAHVAHRRRKQPIDTQHLVMQQIPIFFRPEK